MSWRQGIHGYAARFGVVTMPVSGAAAPRVRFEPGCFEFTAAEVGIWFSHRPWHSYGSGRELHLDIWQDANGLAFSFLPSPHPSSFGLVRGIADGRYAQCSVGWLTISSVILGSGSDAVESISRARLNEISILPEGACPGTACWHSANAPAGIPAHARAALDQWQTGRAGRDARPKKTGSVSQQEKAQSGMPHGSGQIVISRNSLGSIEVLPQPELPTLFRSDRFSADALPAARDYARTIKRHTGWPITEQV